MKLETIALHHGYDSDKNDQKAATTPIYQTSGFTIDDTQHGADLFDLKVEGNIYSRIGNPTNDVLEKRVAAMEGGIGEGAETAAASVAAALVHDRSRPVLTVSDGSRFDTSAPGVPLTSPPRA